MKPGRPRKKKGRGFEVEVVKSIFTAFPQLHEADVTARIMGDAGIDVLLSEAARAILPLAIECKRVGRLENLNLKEAMRQAKANCPLGLIPVVVYREDRHEILATMEAWRLIRVLGIHESAPDRVDLSILITYKWADLLSLLGGKQ